MAEIEGQEPGEIGGEERPRRQRLFVALDLPERIRAGVAAWGREELLDPALRPVRPESLHITLVFLGLTYFIVPAVFMGLHVFVSLLQAYIFMLMTMIYVGGAVAHEH